MIVILKKKKLKATSAEIKKPLESLMKLCSLQKLSIRDFEISLTWNWVTTLKIVSAKIEGDLLQNIEQKYGQNDN